MGFKMKTKIINDTTHEVAIRERQAGILGPVTTLAPKKEYTLESDRDATYREIYVCTDWAWKGGTITISSDDCTDAEEITIYETPLQAIRSRISKARIRSQSNSQSKRSRGIGTSADASETQQLQPSAKVKDFADFDALRKDASSRIETIETSCASVEKLLKLVKICPAQCKNIVQTCLKGTKKMKEGYFAVSERDMWQLYYSKELRQLISSLDRLLSTLGSTKDLLQACGSQWGKMGLVVSIPLPPPEQKTLSKFDLLINELSWNLDTIHYALQLTKDMGFKWNENRRRYVLEENHETGISAVGEMEPEVSERLVLEDRAHFLAHLEDESLMTPKNCFHHLAWQYLGLRTPADRVRDYIAAVLKKRLQEISVLSNESSTVPNCFWINHLDLETRNTLSGESNSKAIYKGKWCGQAVAIGITKGTTRAVVEREAAVMLKVQHPSIVDFLGCAFTDNAPQSVSGGCDKCTAGYLVMELMQEDLRHVIDRRVRIHSGSPFHLAVAIDILLQIVAAMIHMHNRDIIHRDLKAANCLVSTRSPLMSNSQVHDLYTVKLIDFGNSKMLNSDDAISNHTANSGTRRWMAPEVWGTPGVILAPYTKSADVYSFAMTFYEVITGLLPFHECIYNNDLQVVIHEGKQPLLPTSVSCPEGLKELMSKCWAQDPKERPEFTDIEKALWTIKYELEFQ